MNDNHISLEALQEQIASILAMITPQLEYFAERAEAPNFAEVYDEVRVTTAPDGRQWELHCVVKYHAGEDVAVLDVWSEKANRPLFDISPTLFRRVEASPVLGRSDAIRWSQDEIGSMFGEFESLLQSPAALSPIESPAHETLPLEE